MELNLSLGRKRPPLRIGNYTDYKNEKKSFDRKNSFINKRRNSDFINDNITMSTKLNNLSELSRLIQKSEQRVCYEKEVNYWLYTCANNPN